MNIQELKDVICELVSIAEDATTKERFTELDNAGAEIIDKLDELQALKKQQEQGTLIKIPAAEGSEVWKIITQSDNYSGELYKIKTRTHFRVDMIPYIGKSVFLTEEAADAVLDKLRGEYYDER